MCQARGLLWAMSADLVAATVKEFMADREDQPEIPLDEVQLMKTHWFHHGHGWKIQRNSMEVVSWKITDK